MGTGHGNVSKGCRGRMFRQNVIVANTRGDRRLVGVVVFCFCFMPVWWINQDWICRSLHILQYIFKAWQNNRKIGRWKRLVQPRFYPIGLRGERRSEEHTSELQ